MAWHRRRQHARAHDELVDDAAGESTTAQCKGVKGDGSRCGRTSGLNELGYCYQHEGQAS
jgi:hypothetical protein